MPDAAPPARGLRANLSLPAIGAGFLAVLVSYAGPLLVYLQAARAMQIPEAAFTSWVFAISMAAVLSSLILSLWARAPVVTAWSAPGSVLLISIGTGLPFAEIVGAYLLAALAILLIGASGLFDRLVAALPAPVSAGMMAGILFGFGARAMTALGEVPALFALLLAAFLILRALAPNLAIIGVLALGLLLARLTGDVHFEGLHLALARPALTWPAFSAEAVLGLAVPRPSPTTTARPSPGSSPAAPRVMTGRRSWPPKPRQARRQPRPGARSPTTRRRTGVPTNRPRPPASLPPGRVGPDDHHVQLDQFLLHLGAVHGRSHRHPPAFRRRR